MRTLILTNSYDGTADLLIHHLGTQRVFRLNFDLWFDYQIEITSSNFTLSSPSTSIEDVDITKMYWRKPFASEFQSLNDTETDYLESESKAVLRDIFSIGERTNRAILACPSASLNLGKLVQARIARKFFTVPPWQFTSNRQPKDVGPVVVKSLSSAMVAGDRVLFTTATRTENLDPRYPWYCQALVEARYDLTVVYAYGTLFAYALDRTSFNGVDWRRFGIETSGSWFRVKVTDSFVTRVRQFMCACGLDYGRLDFLSQSTTFFDDVVFLEVNSNGQWAWLDLDRSSGLLDHMIQIVDPATVIPTRWRL